MTSVKTTAQDGATAVGGNNAGSIVNVSAGNNSPVSVKVENLAARELPSFLADVIVQFSCQELAGYAVGPRRHVPPEVVEKIAYNNLPEDHRVLVDYRRHSLALERAYHGVEQQNADARYLVRRKAACAYESILVDACAAAGHSLAEKAAYVKQHSSQLVHGVIEKLMLEYKGVAPSGVAIEAAHLAISLVVADAIIECEVLEKPSHVATA